MVTKEFLRNVEVVAIDIGNTHVRKAYFIKGELVREEKVKTRHFNPGSMRIEKETRLVAVSTVPDKLAKLVKVYPGTKVIERHHTGIEKVPKNVGMDRIVNLAAARDLYGSSTVLVVDFGTALTVTAMQRGSFRGGIIVASWGISYRKLAANTALLNPLPELIKDDYLWHWDTNKAINAGIYQLYKQGLENILGKMREELGRKTVVVATGGGVLPLGLDLSPVQIVNPTLLLEGLQRLS